MATRKQCKTVLLMMNTEKENSRSLETAREFVKLAKSYALYKRTEGYDENNYSY